MKKGCMRMRKRCAGEVTMEKGFMTMRKRCAAMVLAVCVGELLLVDSFVSSCGFHRDSPLFYSNDTQQSHDWLEDLHPYVPLKEYTEGNIGVVRPQYGYIYLWIAYRYLTEKPLSTTDIEFLLNVNNTQKKPGLCGANAWAKESNRILAQEDLTPNQYATVMQKTHQKVASFHSFENCCDGAFHYALERLKNVTTQHAYNSPFVMRWVKAQQQVFQNCSVASQSPILPADLPKDASIEEKNEHAYQVASSYFYAMEYEKSAGLFEVIAQDSTSPYKYIAVYLVLRSYYRNLIHKHQGPPPTPSSPDENTEQKTNSWYASIYNYVQKHLPFINRKHTAVETQNDAANPEKLFLDAYRKLSARIDKNPYKEDIEGLHDGVQMRTHPKTVIKAVGDKLVDTSYSLSGHLLQDFDYVVRARPELTGQEKLDNEFFEWRRLFRAKDSYREAYAYWKKDFSPLWLVVVLEKIPVNAPELNDVLAAAETIKKGSPSFVTVSYQRAKLLIQAGAVTKGNEIIDSMLTETIPLSTRNRFLDLKVTTDYHSFLRTILQKPVFKPSEYDYFYDLGQFLDSFSSFVKNNLLSVKEYDLDFSWAHFDAVQKAPVSSLLSAGSQKEFPTWLKQSLLMAAFSRSVLLDMYNEAIKSAEQMRVVQPELKESLDLFLGENDPKRRSLIGHLIILRYPKVSIFVNPHSWRVAWNGDSLNVHEFDIKSGFKDQWWKDQELKKCASSSMVNFQSTDDQHAASHELKALSEKINDKTDYFCMRTLAWFNENPKDPLLPEMMHRCVAMSRYNKHYEGRENLESSYTVFKLLHKHFKQNEYTKKTPFHYYRMPKNLLDK